MSRLIPLAVLDWNSLGWGLTLALAAFVAGILVVVFLIVQLPVTYFTGTPGGWADLHPIIRWALLILKNLLGAVLIAVGIVMLVVPGQGILTILIGVALLNFPGKRTLERKLICRRGILGTINRLRARFGKPPLLLDEQPQPDGCTSGRIVKS